MKEYSNHELFNNYIPLLTESFLINELFEIIGIKEKNSLPYVSKFY